VGPLDWQTHFLLNKLLIPARLVGLLSQDSPPCLAGLSMVLAKRRARLSVAPWCLEVIREGQNKAWMPLGTESGDLNRPCSVIRCTPSPTCQFSRIACAFHSLQMHNSQRHCSGCTIAQLPQMIEPIPGRIPRTICH
jgi:hypothetical protein